MAEDHRVAERVLEVTPAADLLHLADRIAERRPFYIGAYPIVDPPLMRLTERDALVAALRLAAAQKSS